MSQGITAYSSESGQREYVIFSIDDDGPLTGSQFINYCFDKQIGVKVIQGKWIDKYGNDEYERAYVMSWDHYRDYVEFMWCSKQHNVLLLGPCDHRSRRKATMVGGPNSNLKPFDLGMFYSVPEKVAKKRAAWTCDITTQPKEWFVTEEDYMP